MQTQGVRTFARGALRLSAGATYALIAACRMLLVCKRVGGRFRPKVISRTRGTPIETANTLRVRRPAGLERGYEAPRRAFNPARSGTASAADRSRQVAGTVAQPCPAVSRFSAHVPAFKSACCFRGGGRLGPGMPPRKF